MTNWKIFWDELKRAFGFYDIPDIKSLKKLIVQRKQELLLERMPVRNFVVFIQVVSLAKHHKKSRQK